MTWAPVFRGTPSKPSWIDNGAGVMVPAWSEDPCECCGHPTGPVGCPCRYNCSYALTVSGILPGPPGESCICTILNQGILVGASGCSPSRTRGPFSWSGTGAFGVSAILQVECDTSLDSRAGASPGTSLVFAQVVDFVTFGQPTCRASVLFEIANCASFTGTYEAQFSGLFCPQTTAVLTIA